MAKRFGNANTSSLIRSARAAAERNASLQDQYEQYAWELSDKSEAAYQAYTSYLAKREKEATDPSKQLGYRKAQTSAYSAFRSNEIERMNIQINMGGASLYDKKALLQQQFQEAVDLGNYELAQRINLQFTNVDIQIQNQEMAAAAAAARGSGGGGGWGGGGGGSSSASKKLFKKTDEDLNQAINQVEFAATVGGTVQDPITGEEIRVNAANQGEVLRNLLLKRAGNLEEQINTLGDADGEAAQALSNLITSDAFIKSKAYLAYQNVPNNFDAGSVGKARDWNPQTQTYDIVDLPLREGGQTRYLTDKDGNVIRDPYSNIPIALQEYDLGFDGEVDKAKQLFNFGQHQKSGRRLVWNDRKDGKDDVRREETWLDENGQEYIKYFDKITGDERRYYPIIKTDKNGKPVLDKNGDPVIHWSPTPVATEDGNALHNTKRSLRAVGEFAGKAGDMLAPAAQPKNWLNAFEAVVNPAETLNNVAKGVTNQMGKAGKFDPKNFDFNPFDGDGVNFNPFVSDVEREKDKDTPKIERPSSVLTTFGNAISKAASGDVLGGVMNLWNDGREYKRKQDEERKIAEMKRAAEAKAAAEAAARAQETLRMQQEAARRQQELAAQRAQQDAAFRARQKQTGLMAPKPVGPIRNPNLPSGLPNPATDFIASGRQALKNGYKPTQKKKFNLFNPSTWF